MPNPSFRIKIAAGIASAALAALALVAPLTAGAADPQFKIKYVSASPPGSQTSVPIVWWAKEVEQRSAGRIKIEFFWSGSLIKGPDILGAVGKGIVPMGKIYTVDYTGQMPLNQLANLPFTAEDVYVLQRAITDMNARYPGFGNEYSKNNVFRLGGLATGTVHLLSKNPIKSLKDIEGMSVRARGPQAQVLKAVGAVPVSVAFGELYQALDRGIIGSTIMYELSIMPYKFNEIARNLTYVGLGHAMQAEVVNKDFWEAMPADLRKIMQVTMTDAEVLFSKTFDEKLRKETKQMTDGDGTPKVAFYHLSDAELNSWQTKSQQVYDEWMTQNAKAGNTAEMLKTFRELLDKYKAEVKASGYPKMTQ